MTARFIELPDFATAAADLHASLRVPADSLVDGPDGDHGHFGPESVSWRVYWHPATGVAGFAALLVQALHPVCMAAVDQHSTYKVNGWTRAMAILRFELAVVYGSRALAGEMAAHVRRVHAQITGVDPHTGRTYRADDEDLLLWIHCASAMAVLRAYAMLGPGLDRPDADRFVGERVAAARLVGIESLAVPASVGELDEYLRDARCELAMTPAARDVLREFRAATAPPSTWPFWKLHLAGALHVLPRWVRDAYDLPAPPARARRVERVALRAGLAALRGGYALSPGFRPARERLRAVARS